MREKTPITTIKIRESKSTVFSPTLDFNIGFMISTDKIVLVVKRHVSAEDIIAERSAAIMRPFKPIGKTWLIIVGKEASGLIWGNSTLADIPIRVMIKAKGSNPSATVMVAFLAVVLSLEQKSLEYISGPTK